MAKYTVNENRSLEELNNATTSKDGLMAANDKTKLNSVAANADDVSFTQTVTSGTKIGEISINGNSKNIYIPEIKNKIWVNICNGYNIYTAESPYSLTPDRSDCYVYLTTSMNFPCTIGKKYRISCTTDGLWSSNHGVVGSRLCTLWVCDGGHNYHQCFYGDNQTSGTMTWEWTASFSGTAYFRVNTYGNGNPTVKFWDFRAFDDTIAYIE